jgi:uncharacterized membrane protein (UPF0127 family)
MRIFNESNKTVISSKTEIAKSFWSKALGLMFRAGIGKSEGLLLDFGNEGDYGIWMLGMRFPIDIAFIDSKKRVVDVFRGVRPIGLDLASWKVYHPSKPARWALELSSGRLKATRTSKGDRVSW